MNSPQSRLFRMVAVTGTVAALASPTGGSAVSGGTSPRTGSQSQSRAPVVVRVDGGFNWASAGVGAAGGLGLMLVVGGAASAIRRAAVTRNGPDLTLRKGV